MVAFNSPVWFNVGFEENPQCSACFILSVEDSMDSILDWITKEGRVFRGGSGSGINLSKLRSSKEQLSKGGYASGPVSFMRGADASAGTIKSGGKTRRAAKMVVLNVDHPDIEEFIWCKQHEEEKARVLQAAGYDMSLDSPDWASIQYQNANNSVRVTDEFMRAVLEDEEWNLTARTDGSVVGTVRARDLMHQISEAAWKCADPGMHYDTTMNDWHTCPASGRINASNPCSEYLHVDNSACNLASLNLMKFRDPESLEFQVERFERAVDIIFMAQEILVSNSSYPTEEITRNANAMRQLGLGYANLGALLMARGLPYDSDEGRAYAGAITAIMTGRAYRKSADMAGRIGPFEEYAKNSDAMLRVIRKHRAAVANIDAGVVPDEMMLAARKAWDEALALGEANGYRNAQATVLAPTGTISLHDGLRHHRRRARLLAGQVEEAGRRRRHHDRQPDGADRALQARLRAARDRPDRRLRQRAQHGRGRARVQGRAPAGVRRGRGRPRDPPHGPRQDDGRRCSRSSRARSRRPSTCPPRSRWTTWPASTSTPGSWA